MLARKRTELTEEEAKSHLKKHGWSYRNVTKQDGGPLEVTYVHLCLVLNKHRASRRLLKKIAGLPKREDYLAKKLEVSHVS